MIYNLLRTKHQS